MIFLNKKCLESFNLFISYYFRADFYLYKKFYYKNLMLQNIKN